MRDRVVELQELACESLGIATRCDPAAEDLGGHGSEGEDENTGRTAIIEFPVKTINRHWDTRKWQVDTGPILLPDLTSPPNKWSQSLKLAYIAFNASDRADFVIEQSTNIKDGEKDVAKVYHYSGLVAMKTCNVLIALDEE